MSKETQRSDIDKAHQMRVSKTVLQMINHKKYPLCIGKLNKMKRNKEKYQIMKRSTCQSELTSYHVSTHYNSKSSLQIPYFHRSMGEHFLQENTRSLMFPYRASEDLQQINSKIHTILWQRKKEVIQKYSSLDKYQLDSEMNQKNDQKKTPKGRRSFDNLPTILRHLRTRLAQKLINQNESSENCSHRRSGFFDQTGVNQLEQQPSFNFLEGQKEMMDLMRRYPIQSSTNFKQNLNLQLERDMIKELKQNLGNDKYSKMRIVHNHKKIVRLG